MVKIFRCEEDDWMTLAGIWERAVRTTHRFLAEEDFMDIRGKLVSEYFKMAELYAVVEEDGNYAGFIGLSGCVIEMLFVDSNRLRCGLGTILVDFAKRLGATKVDVNEQNHQALDFYLAQGFRIINRDPTDESGRQYPILHLSL